MASETREISGATLLGILFIGLKLGHVIDWSWLWVLAPFWVGIALVLAMCACVLVPFLVGLLVVLLVKIGRQAWRHLRAPRRLLP